MVMSVIPEATSSRTVCSITGLSPTGNISFGMAFVNGSSREPRPAAGITALRIAVGIVSSFSLVRPWCLLRWRQSGLHQLDFADPAVRIVSLTITEGGYFYH